MRNRDQPFSALHEARDSECSTINSQPARACAAIGGVFFSQVETPDRQLSFIKRLVCSPLQ